MSDSRPKARSIRVLLVDDHAMIRQGLRCALECYPSIEVVGEAGDGFDRVNLSEFSQDRTKYRPCAASKNCRICQSDAYKCPEMPAPRKLIGYSFAPVPARSDRLPSLRRPTTEAIYHRGVYDP